MATYVTTHEGVVAGQSEWPLIGGSLTEASGGAAAVILAILGLVHVLPDMLLAIATIVLGGAFLLLGGVLAARFASNSAMRTAAVPEDLGEGMAAISLAGASGIVLGIIALIGTDLTVLVPVAAIVYGAALLIASTTAARVEATAHGRIAYHTTPAPDALIGLGGIVLGILALSGFAPLVLSLIAVLAFGVALMLKASFLASGTFASYFK